MKIIPHSGLIRRKLEAWFIRRAVGILAGRNVTRSAVVSRRDNNDMYHMADDLEGIAMRISSGYKSVLSARKQEGDV